MDIIREWPLWPLHTSFDLLGLLLVGSSLNLGTKGDRAQLTEVHLKWIINDFIYCIFFLSMSWIFPHLSYDLKQIAIFSLKSFFFVHTRVIKNQTWENPSSKQIHTSLGKKGFWIFASKDIPCLAFLLDWLSCLESWKNAKIWMAWMKKSAQKE